MSFSGLRYGASSCFMPGCASKKHHGNNQSSLATQRAANYPTVNPSVFDCICIFHDLSCQFIWERQLPQLDPFRLILPELLTFWFCKNITTLHRKCWWLMDEFVSCSCKTGISYFLSTCTDFTVINSMTNFLYVTHWQRCGRWLKREHKDQLQSHPTD